MIEARARCGWLAVLAVLAGATQAAGAEEKKESPAPKIQMAILLDTSNSMDGLINQARTQLWKIVSEFTTIRLAGKVPTLEVALYEYGNDNLPPQEGFLRMVVPLTSDLDKVSEAMFKLQTRGGNEFCGLVIDCATRQLAWSNTNKDIKCIFIAGNEPFTQGQMDFRKACKAAADKGITVNTIFCGSHQEGVDTFWQTGAQLADGQYLSIDQNQQVAGIAAPQDREIAQLGAQLNNTYLPYGDAKKRAEAAQRQIAQDANAARSAAGVAASRMAVKASAMYRNPTWDLVDALSEGRVNLENVKEDQLPEALQGMRPAERKAYVEQLAQQRKEIQGKIAKLNDARKAYVAQEQKKLEAQARASARVSGTGYAAAAPAASPSPAFEKAVVDAVKAEAAKR